MTASDLPKLYHELAEWWPLLSAPEDYAEEADVYRQTLIESSQRPIKTLLELGSGGGNNASHLKTHFELTLVDLSPDMLAMSQQLNPECKHHQGNMRTVRLDQTFDAVFIHDAIGYLTQTDDLKQAIETAFIHCNPGGIALFVPDVVRETFHPFTKHGGHDGEHRALRYMEWVWDPDPQDTSYIMDFVYLIRFQKDALPQAITDRHVLGMFEQQQWLDWISEAGFEADQITRQLSDEPNGSIMFIGKKPNRKGNDEPKRATARF